MSLKRSSPGRQQAPTRIPVGLILLLGLVAVMGTLFLFRIGLLIRALALQSEQVTWFVTRSAGWTAYLLLWASTAWGIAVPSKIFDGVLQRQFTYDFHEFLSLLALVFTAIHVGVLAFDQYMPFNVLQILAPFLSTYRPVWMGVGGVAVYLSLLVTITFYARQRIGSKAFRQIHLLSLVAFFGSALHGLFGGTDSSLAAAQFLYAATTLSIIFLIAYWLIMVLQLKLSPKPVSLQQKKS